MNIVGKIPLWIRKNHKDTIMNNTNNNIVVENTTAEALTYDELREKKATIHNDGISYKEMVNAHKEGKLSSGEHSITNQWKKFMK